jgi:hypothetical protein
MTTENEKAVREPNCSICGEGHTSIQTVIRDNGKVIVTRVCKENGCTTVDQVLSEVNVALAALQSQVPDGGEQAVATELVQMAEWLDNNANYIQMDYDHPPEPGSQFDFELVQASGRLREIAYSLRPSPAANIQARDWPEILFDGWAVYEEVKAVGREQRTSHECVSDTLDAIVRILKRTPLMDAAYYRAEFERECNDGDALLEIIGIRQNGRTDGGSINIGKVREYQQQTIETLMQLIREKDARISELSTSPAKATDSEGQAVAAEPVAWMAVSDDDERHLGFDKQDLYREVLRVYTMQPLYTAPFNADLLVGAAYQSVEQALLAAREDLKREGRHKLATELANCAALISTLTPDAARKELERVCMEVAEEVRLQICKAQRTTGDYYLSMDELVAIVHQVLSKGGER